MKKLLRPDWLSLYAIVGYLLFLLFQTRPDLSTLFLFVFGLTAFLSSDGPRPHLRHLDYLALLLFAGAGVLATVFSEDPARSARYLVYLGMNVFLLLLAASLSNKTQVKVVLGCLAFLGLMHLGAVLIVGKVAEPAIPEAIIARQSFVTLLVPNDALIIGLCLPALAIFLWQLHQRWTAIALLVIVVFLSFAVYASYLLQSKVALISVLAALFALVAAWRGIAPGTDVKNHRKWPVFLVVAMLLLMAPAAWYLGNQSTTRLGLWSHAMANSSAAEILVGSGPNTFNYDPALIASPIENGQRIIPWAHNLFLESYSEQGLLGLMGILAITIIPVIRSARLEDQAMRAFMFASVLTFVLLGMLEITLTRRFYFAYLALMYGLTCSPALRRSA